MMTHKYCEMQNKLSNTRGSPLGSMGEIISSRCPKQNQDSNNIDDQQKKQTLERSLKIFYWRAYTSFTVRQPQL